MYVQRKYVQLRIKIYRLSDALWSEPQLYFVSLVIVVPMRITNIPTLITNHQWSQNHESQWMLVLHFFNQSVFTVKAIASAVSSYITLGSGQTVPRVGENVREALDLLQRCCNLAVTLFPIITPFLIVSRGKYFDIFYEKQLRICWKWNKKGRIEYQFTTKSTYTLKQRNKIFLLYIRRLRE